MLTATAVVLAALFVFASRLLATRRTVTLWVAMPILVSTALFQREIWAGDVTTNPLPDIAAGHLQLTTYTLAAIMAVLSLGLFGRYIPFSGIHIIVIVMIAVMITFGWGDKPHQWSGFMVLFCASVAWAVGRALGKEIRSAPTVMLAMLRAIVVILAIQLALSLAQLAGLQFPGWLTAVSERSDDIESTGRAVGTMGHPANLSKIAVLFTVLVLPFTAHGNRKIQRLALLVIGLSVALSGVTISRANILAIVGTIVLWILISPRGVHVRTRVTVLIFTILGTLAFAGDVIARFGEDPVGGSRSQLLDAALEQVSRTPWSGTGINSYIPVVAAFDRWTALGYPVHNTTLLAVAEFGIPLGFLWFLPLVSLWAYAALRFLHRDRSPVTRAILCSIPAVLVVTQTGWGMLSAGYLSLWFLISGFQRGSLDDERPSGTKKVSGSLPHDGGTDSTRTFAVSSSSHERLGHGTASV